MSQCLVNKHVQLVVLSGFTTQPRAASAGFEFDESGRFSTGSGASSFSGGGAITSSSDGTGPYQVNGNLIRLSFNDGTVEGSVFSTYEGSDHAVFMILISEAVFNLDRE